MKRVLFSALASVTRDKLLHLLASEGNTFFPKWSVSLILPSAPDRYWSADAVNDWLKENDIDGYASGAFLRCLLADDDGLAQFMLRWSDGNL